MFTIDQVILRLREQGVRDTDLPDAHLPLDEKEELVIVQDFQNKKINLRVLLQYFEGSGYLEGAIKIGDNGNWIISGVDTNIRALGPQGEQGVQGLSAYDVALANGYEGTIEQWVEDLLNLKGDKGDQGETGETGEIGPKGVVAQDTPPSDDVVWIDTSEDYPTIIQYDWDGTKLGIKTENEDSFTYVDLMSKGINYYDLSEVDRAKVKGPKGEQGGIGQRGVLGEQGREGIQGEPFKFNNFTFEQLIRLKGDKGDQGLIGPRGLEGVGRPFLYSDFTTKQLERLRGDIGPRGFQGEQGREGKLGKEGEQGQKGNNGYSPIKGVDYRDGYTPIKGKDYFDGSTPIKNVDYFDGTNGTDGQKGILILTTAPTEDVVWLDTTENYPPAVLLELDKDELKTTLSNTDKLPIWDDVAQKFILVTMLTLKDFLQTK